ncbi:hypothetical protein [Bathycoccus sp. RCC716 virus 1]|uniref:Apple domain-containing protein n=1 Tax=Bathycoccus sp. RCC716 virus 1 TaxID=2530038 RepID=A0A7S6NY27_9PHYC|nr:hypothetical protein [Bathycoccus sp. RCC716 virus 1]
MKSINQKKYTPLIKEMAKAVITLGLFALLVIIIIGIALAVYFTTKKSSEETPDKPQLTFDSNATKTINPQEDAEVESYMIEYAEGDDSEKSKLIDLTLSWTNQEGFDNVVDKLIFTRYVGTTEIQDNKEVEDADMIKDYGSGSVTFKGTEVSEGVSVKGENVIKAYYNEVKEANLLATARMRITESDFNTTLAGPFGDLVVPVSISSESFKLTKKITKTLYQISHAPGRWFNVVSQGNDIYQFKFNDGKFLEFDDQNKFKLSMYKGKKMLLTENGEKIWVPTRGSWVPIGKMKKDDYRFAQCDLFGANMIMQTGETLNPSDKIWLSPNKEFRAVYQKSDGNFVVYKENDSNNAIHAHAGSNGSFNLRLSANGNISFKKSGDELVKSAQGYKHAVKKGLTGPFLFMVSDFGGLHVVSKEGVELMNYNRAFGALSNYYKTHAGDLWGYDNKKYTGKTFDECSIECDKDLYCAGFTYDHGNKNCWAKNYDARYMGVDPENDQNADRWTNFNKEDGSTDWKAVQYYQKKVDSNCYRDRYPDLKNAFGVNSINLLNHYYSHGRDEGRDPTCNTTVPLHAKKGYYPDPDVKYYSSEFDKVKKVGWKGCKDTVAAKGFEIWGVRSANNNSDWSNTCFGYKKGAAATELKGGEAPNHHFVGCVNGKTLSSGCTSDE